MFVYIKYIQLKRVLLDIEYCCDFCELAKGVFSLQIPTYTGLMLKKENDS